MSASESNTVEGGLDNRGLATLVASHRRFLSFLERRVDSRETAEEILQSAFVKAIEKKHENSRTETSVAWFFRLLRNAVIDHYRRRAARERSVAANAAELEASVEFDEQLRSEVCACFEGLLPTLKPEYATIVRAVDLDSRPIAEVACELGISTNNAGVRLHRAREALRRRLEQACSTCAVHGCLDCTCGSGRR